MAENKKGSDFLTGTILMTNEQKGKYITLLCIQHQKGVLSEKDMLNICSSYDKEVFDKFIKSDEGYYNERMRFEHNKRSNFSKSRSENRLKGIENKKVKKVKKAKISYDNHMENENENTIIYYREIKHLKITSEEVSKLLDLGYTMTQIDDIFDRIENFKNNTNYVSLYLTSIAWLKRQYPNVQRDEKCPYTEVQIREVQAQKSAGFGCPEWFDKKWEHLI